MLDEWREKFVLSQQEAIDIYTEMHRHLAAHGFQVLTAFACCDFSEFPCLSPRSEVSSFS